MIKNQKCPLFLKFYKCNFFIYRYEQIGDEKVRAVEEMLKQTEEDADKEILELKTRYERILRSERDANVRLRGEAGIGMKCFINANIQGV